MTSTVKVHVCAVTHMFLKMVGIFFFKLHCVHRCFSVDGVGHERENWWMLCSTALIRAGTDAQLTDDGAAGDETTTRGV